MQPVNIRGELSISMGTLVSQSWDKSFSMPEKEDTC